MLDRSRYEKLFQKMIKVASVLEDGHVARVVEERDSSVERVACYDDDRRTGWETGASPPNPR